MEPVAEEDLYLYCYAAGTQFREVYGLKMIHYAYCSLMIKYNYCGNGFMVPVLEKQKWNHASIHSYCQHAPQDALLFLYIMKVKHMKKVYYLYV